MQVLPSISELILPTVPEYVREICSWLGRAIVWLVHEAYAILWTIRQLFIDTFGRRSFDESSLLITIPPVQQLSKESIKQRDRYFELFPQLPEDLIRIINGFLLDDRLTIVLEGVSSAQEHKEQYTLRFSDLSEKELKYDQIGRAIETLNFQQLRIRSFLRRNWYIKRALTDQHIQKIMSFFPNLKTFHLKNYNNPFSGDVKLSSKGLQIIADSAPHLRELAIWKETMMAEDFLTITRFTELRKLCLGCLSSNDIDAGIGQLRVLEHLEELNLAGCGAVDSSILGALESIPKLKKLTLGAEYHSYIGSRYQPCEPGFGLLTRVSQLREVDLTACTALTLDALHELKKLRPTLKIIAQEFLFKKSTVDQYVYGSLTPRAGLIALFQSSHPDDLGQEYNVYYIPQTPIKF